MTLASENKGMEAPAPAGGTLKDVKGSTEALQIAAGSTADEKENKSDGHGKTAGKTPAASLEDDQEMRQLANEALKSINGKSVCLSLASVLSAVILFETYLFSPDVALSSQHPQKSWITTTNSRFM